MSSGWRAAVAVLLASVAVASIATAGTASADNSNSNTNNNDVTQQGGDGSDTSGSESTNWPPTDVSWPPKEVLNGGVDKGGNGNSAGPPIVMPMGQPAPARTATPSETAKPIVPVGSP